MKVIPDRRILMGNEWKRTLGIGQGRGIPGITRPVGAPGSEIVNYEGDSRSGRRRSLRGGLGDVLSAPVDLIGVGVQAVVGASALWLGRKMGISDPTFEKKNESDKAKEKREKLMKELEGTNNWTNAIKAAIDNSERLRNNPNRTSSLAASTLGSEAMKLIDGSFAVNQGTPVEVKPVQENEISFAQRILAAVNGTDDLERMVDLELNKLALENIQEVGEMAVDSIEANRLRQLRSENNIKVTTVTWWESLLAAVGGATGGQRDAIRGGYEVTVKDGTLALRVGEDYNQIAPPGEVIVDFDIPKIYEAALSVAEEKVPILKGKFSNWVRGMIEVDEKGDIPLKPGRVDIGKTGSDEAASFPALNVGLQVDRISRVKKAGGELNMRLMELEKVASESSEQMLKRLLQGAVEGVQEIPRKRVVMDILGKITASGGVSIQPDNRNNEKTVKVDVVGDVLDIKQQKVTETKKLSQIEIDLKNAGISNMDVRTAKIIIDHISDFEKEWSRKFGNKDGKRMVRNISRRAKSILEIANKG